MSNGANRAGSSPDGACGWRPDVGSVGWLDAEPVPRCRTAQSWPRTTVAEVGWGPQPRDSLNADLSLRSRSGLATLDTCAPRRDGSACRGLQA